METIIFRDSPLAEYLEGNGEGDSIWPGVGSSTFVDPTEPNHHFAPSARSISLNPRGKSKGLNSKNLQLASPGWRQSRSYLYELFSKLADARLSRSENARFLERFRYIIVASQLLGEHINVSHYNRRSGDLLPPQLTDDDNSTAFFGPRFAKARYFAGNGLCIGIVTLIIGWVLKLGDRQRFHFSVGRAGLGFLGIALVAIFCFTNARRRWLRTIRGRTIQLATQFVESSQAYDILVSNAVTFIQEVELVSRGYRLSTPLPPVTRLDIDSNMRRCARLRKSVLTSLNLAMTPYIQAFHALKGLTQGTDLDKYYDIYDIRNEDVESITSGVQQAEFDDMESLKALKALLHRLHTTRKIFLCCLLALDANGGYEDFGTWRTAIEQLKSVSTVMGELGETLQRHSEEESRFNVPPTPSTTRPTTSSATSPTRERWRGKLRKLNSLSQALRGLQAKMQILREESDKALQDDSMDLVEFGPDLLAHYDSIGSDLHALMSEWENGRALLVMSIDKQGGDSTGSNRNSLMTPLSPMGWGGQASSSSSLDGDTPRNSWGVLSPTGEGAEAVLRLKEKMGELSEEGEDVDDGKTEMIFEGTAEPRGAGKAKSGLTREERIRKVQEERVRLMEERRKKEEAGNLVKELQSVLGNRPPVLQRRMPVRSSSS